MDHPANFRKSRQAEPVRAPRTADAFVANQFALVLLVASGILLINGCSRSGTRYQPSGKTGWMRCVSKNGRFSVLMPGQPKERREEELAGKIKIVLHTLTAEPNRSQAFSVQYNDFPP